MSEGWKPISAFDYNGAHRDCGSKYFEISNGFGRRAIAKYQIVDTDDDGDPVWDWQRRRPDAIDGDNLGFEAKAFRPILHADDHAFQNAVVMFKEELKRIRRENGGEYTAGQVVVLMDKYFPNWYIRDVGIPGVEMSELQDKLEISFKFEFAQIDKVVQKKKTPMADPAIRELVDGITEKIASATARYLREPSADLQDEQLKFISDQMRSMCAELVSVSVVKTNSGALQIRLSQADGARLLESVGWDTLNAMLTKGFVLIEEK